MVRWILTLLLVVAVAGVVVAAVVDNGNGTATISYTGPGHAITDLCVAMGWLDGTCSVELFSAGGCGAAIVGQALPTVTCSASHVAAGRCRSAILDQPMPAPSACAAAADLWIEDHLRRMVLRGRDVYRARQAPPLDESEPFQ